LGALLVGCERRKSPASGTRVREKVDVLGTVYPLADVAQQVGGDDVKVSWIIESGESLVGFNPGAEARSRLRTAQILIAGGMTEPWAVGGAADVYQHERLIRLDALNMQSAISADAGFLWMDPLIVCDGAREFSNKLGVLIPEHHTQIKSRADDYIAKLNALVQEYQPKLSGAATRKVLVLSHDFDPLLRRFSFIPILAVNVPPTRLSDTDLRHIRSLAEENRTRLLAVSSDTPQIVVRDIETRASVQIVPLDALGSSGAGGRNTYLGLIRWDLEQLLHATTVR
jgi:zinc transport system substrate-binding protein